MTITLTKTKLAIAVLAVVMLVPATAWATHVFTDVPDGAFYADPVEWAFNNEITTGTSATTFSPLDNVTRGESVTFLKRYDDKVVQPALDAIGEGAAGPQGEPGPQGPEGPAGTSATVTNALVFEFDDTFPPGDYSGTCPADAPIALGGSYFFPDEGLNLSDAPAWANYPPLLFRVGTVPPNFRVDVPFPTGFEGRLAVITECAPLDILPGEG